jgi:hypothetical protein
MTARPTGADLHLSVCLDGQTLFNNIIQETTVVNGSLDDNNAHHILLVLMSQKIHDHTKLNELGEIISDRLIVLSDIMIDDVDITKIFQFKSVYTHDFNGTQPEINQGFYGSMGCNGIVKLEFNGPVYSWLLENM